MRILVIDDDEVARELLSSTLRHNNHEVFELATAIDATRLIFEQEIDAVVVDVNLPDMNGDKLARILRQNSRGPTLGIVLVSTLPDDELRHVGLLAQADGVLSKSNVRAQLESAVTQACERRARPARAQLG
ncbi:MAG TPA: response regulator [Polyangiaceae bacterium]|nr:response regulator [Polyangiaceae bacterium]